jgi:hypothetical protein
MRKIWRENGVSSRQRRKKHVTKNNLRHIKKEFDLFQHTCEDTKYLNDIPEYWPYMTKLGLPKVQYTYREVSSGIMYLGYADGLSLTYATLFSEYIQYNLKTLGIDLSNTTRQTDNGSEYIGSWNAKEPSIFTLSVESIPGQKHSTIPPAHYRWQADVETVHDVIEREFFEIETFSDNEDFFNKAFSYQLFFNMVRPNTYKENKSPWQLAQEKIPDIKKEVLMIPPVDLRSLLRKKMDFQSIGVYDVSSSPSRIQSFTSNHLCYLIFFSLISLRYSLKRSAAVLSGILLIILYIFFLFIDLISSIICSLVISGAIL